MAVSWTLYWQISEPRQLLGRPCRLLSAIAERDRPHPPLPEEVANLNRGNDLSEVFWRKVIELAGKT